MANLKINTFQKEPGIYVVSLFGPLDTATYQKFEKEVFALVSSTTKAIILNMEGVDYISSMGIGAVFNISNTVSKNKGNVVVTNLQPQIKKVFDTVKALPESIFSSVEEADEYLNMIQKKALGKEGEDS